RERLLERVPGRRLVECRRAGFDVCQDDNAHGHHDRRDDEAENQVDVTVFVVDAEFLERGTSAAGLDDRELLPGICSVFLYQGHQISPRIVRNVTIETYIGDLELYSN